MAFCRAGRRGNERAKRPQADQASGARTARKRRDLLGKSRMTGRTRDKIIALKKFRAKIEAGEPIALWGGDA